MEEKKLRIFIAEDEPLNLIGFRDMVEECGHEVIGMASDGESAIKSILQLKPDLILMDINMPGADGITVIETINQTAAIPAVVITGYRSEKYVERAVHAGVYGYLQKPLDEYEVRSAIRIAYTQFQKAQEAKREKEKAENRLKERKVIERAKECMMDNFGLTGEQAMKAMQKKSADSNRKLYLVAEEILKKGEKFK